MASIKSVGFMTPQMMPVDGRAVFINDKVALASAPATSDTLDFRIPAGLEVSELDLVSDRIDTGGAPTWAYNVGYAPIDSASALAPNATYFGSGVTIGRTAGISGQKLVFKPITFQEDVYLRLTVTQAQTFAAGEVHAIVSGNAKGPR